MTGVTVVVSNYCYLSADLQESNLLICSQCFPSVPVDVNNRAEMIKIVKSCLGTKFIKKW